MSRVIVAGSINMDIVAIADRHPAVGETVLGRELHYFPGGKGANQAVAAARLGATTMLIGKTGSDGFGDQLIKFLSTESVDTRFAGKSQKPTGVALIVVANSNNSIVVVPGANDDVLPGDIPSDLISKGDILVAQFETPLRTIAAFFAEGRRAGARTILNPAPAQHFDRTLGELTDILILNETELAFLASIDPAKLTGPDDVRPVIERVRSSSNQIVIVTLGEAGACALLGDRFVRIPGRKVKAIDTTGAGDCFVGALARRLAAGKDIDDAVKYANTAASLCVQQLGAGSSMPAEAAVEAVLS